jgi:hypothetical protein
VPCAAFFFKRNLHKFFLLSAADAAACALLFTLGAAPVNAAFFFVSCLALNSSIFFTRDTGAAPFNLKSLISPAFISAFLLAAACGIFVMKKSGPEAFFKALPGVSAPEAASGLLLAAIIFTAIFFGIKKSSREEKE